MALREGDKANFNTLLKAAKNGDLALLETKRTSDGSYVAILAAVFQEEPGISWIESSSARMSSTAPGACASGSLQTRRVRSSKIQIEKQ